MYYLERKVMVLIPVKVGLSFKPSIIPAIPDSMGLEGHVFHTQVLYTGKSKVFNYDTHFLFPLRISLTMVVNSLFTKQICGMHQSYQKIAILIANTNLVTIKMYTKQYKD